MDITPRTGSHNRYRARARITAAACAALLAVTSAGCAAAGTDGAGAPAAHAAVHHDDHHDDHRGALLSATRLRTWSANQTAAYLTRAEFDPSTVRNGVRLYRLMYGTVDVHGRPTRASGLLVLPRVERRHLHVVSFGHGTAIYRRDVPSTPDDFSASPGVLYGANGFASVSPDYLGQGSGPGRHPWLHARTEASAALDMLRAARAFASSRHLVLDRDVLATGFSQGASTALALGRELQRGADHWFRLGALAPVSGAYALRDAEVPAILDGDVPPTWAVAYVALLFVSWNRIYHLYDSPREVFRAKYADDMERLMSGDTPGDEVAEGLPSSLEKLLTKRGFDLLEHPGPRLRRAMAQADSVCHWRPDVPIRLYRVTADEQANRANTDVCRRALAAHGVPVPVVELGTPEYQDSRHLGSAVAGATATVTWFRQLTRPDADGSPGTRHRGSRRATPVPAGSGR